MGQIAGIYGYEFTRPFVIDAFAFTPTTNNHDLAHANARNKQHYVLTGTVRCPLLSKLHRHRLEAVLSFIEHLDVFISDPVEAEDGQPAAAFDQVIKVRPRHDGGGALIGRDAINPWRDDRARFIELALSRLEDAAFCERTKWHLLLFKSVETFRQRQPFIEISFYLLISALEAFARATTNFGPRGGAATAIARALGDHGFDIKQDCPADLPRAVSTYLHIRNALFHQGATSTTVSIDGSNVALDAADYFFHLSMLASLLIMKAIDFEGVGENWDCWYDRRSHI